MNRLLPDLRYAVRALRRSPVTASAVLILALGIGANTAIFSVVRAVLLRPLPFREPDRIAWVWATRVDRDRAFYSIPNFLDTKARARSFEDLAGLTPWGPTLSGDAEPERLSALRVTGNAFALLGARAEAGRVLSRSDAEPDAARVAVLGHGLWTRRFGADPGVLGRSIRLNGESYAVVGVLTRDFLFPGAEDAELAIPLSLATDPRRTERGSNFLRVFGRLAPRRCRARAELRAPRRSSPPLPRPDGKLMARVLALSGRSSADRGGSCSCSPAPSPCSSSSLGDLASLAFVRALGHRHEVAVRKALGAGGAADRAIRCEPRSSPAPARSPESRSRTRRHRLRRASTIPRVEAIVDGGCSPSRRRSPQAARSCARSARRCSPRASRRSGASPGTEPPHRAAVPAARSCSHRSPCP